MVSHFRNQHFHHQTVLQEAWGGTHKVVDLGLLADLLDPWRSLRVEWLVCVRSLCAEHAGEQ